MDAVTDTVRILGPGSGDHVTLLTRGTKGLLVARVFMRPVPLLLDAAIRHAVCAGQPFSSDLPDELVDRLTGFQARASLGPFVGLPDIVDAGVSRAVPAGFTQPAASYGYARVITRWIEGTPLVDGHAKLSLDAKIAVLDDLARLLADLESRSVVHMALAPSGVVADESRAWLIDLAPLRRKVSGGKDHASALGCLAAWLLAPELSQADPSPGVARWSDVIARAAAPGSERAEPANVAIPTIFVPDERDRQPPGGAMTLFVPDEMPPTGRTMTDLLGRWSRWRGFLLAASLALVLTVAALVVIAYSSSRSSRSSGTPAVAAEPSGGHPELPAAQDELPIEARPRCTYHLERGGDSTMTVMCAVKNRGPIWARVRVTAWLYEGEGAARPVGAENALLAPAELVTLRFDAPAPTNSKRGSRCDCRVEALH